MQQHPVPQNITAFEFKLIGFLTIRQFAFLAAAGIFIFIIFISPIPGFVKFILITPFALLGIALAFVPINGLSFDKWLVVFFHSIYSPTRRMWHKEPKEISFLSPSFSSYLKRPKAAHKRVKPDRGRLESYISKLRKEKKASHLDIFEERRLSKLDFGATVPHFTSAAYEKEQPAKQTPPAETNIEGGSSVGRPISGGSTIAPQQQGK